MTLGWIRVAAVLKNLDDDFLEERAERDAGMPTSWAVSPTVPRSMPPATGMLILLPSGLGGTISHNTNIGVTQNNMQSIRQDSLTNPL